MSANEKSETFAELRTVTLYASVNDGKKTFQAVCRSPRSVVAQKLSLSYSAWIPGCEWFSVFVRLFISTVVQAEVSSFEKNCGQSSV